jgi:uncharacterized protein YjbI with pentapeptide repeats
MKYSFFVAVVVLAMVFIGVSVRKSPSVLAQTAPSIIPFVCPSCDLGHIGKRLKNADLTDAYLRGTRFDQTGGNIVNLTGVTLNGADLFGVYFGEDTILNNAKIKNALFDNMSVVKTHMTNVNFKNTSIVGGNFTEANLQGSNFTGTTITDTSFSDSDLTNADMTGIIDANNSEFGNTNLTNVNFTNANLTGATQMGTANVTGAIWSNTTCPDGTNSNSNGNTCVGHF